MSKDKLETLEDMTPEKYVSKERLRALALKHYKRAETLPEAVEAIAVTRWIEDFFNLTEADLK